MRLHLCLLSALCLLATPALAQDEEPAAAEEGTATTTDTTDADADAGDADTGDTAAEVSEESAPATSGGYPIAEIDRPLVLPVMMLEARGGATFAHLSIDLGPLGSSSQNIIGLFAGAGFGVVEGVEAGIGGGFFPSGPGLGLQLLLSPEFDLGDLPLYGMYDLTDMLAIEGLQIAGRLSFNLPLQSDFGILVDAPAKFHVTEMLAIVGTAGVGTTLGDAKGLLIALNAGALVQATEQIAATATIGMLAFVGDGSSVLIPLAVRGQYNVIEFLDVYADLSFVDLNNWGADWVLIQGGVAYRLQL